MFEELSASCAHIAALGECEGHGDADHKHERRLNEVPENDAGPLAVIDLFGEESTVRIICERTEAEAEADEGDHDDAAIDIEGEEALRQLRRRGGGNVARDGNSIGAEQAHVSKISS